MTLEELKAAWDQAIADALKDPSDKDLAKATEEAKAAYETAKAKADDEGGEDDETGLNPDETKLDDKTKAYLKKLRDENAKHRNKSKDLASKLKVTEEQKRAILKAAGIETDEEKPEEKVKKLQGETQSLAVRSAILESAIHFGISRDDLEFYEFLVTKEASKLEEGDELAEEALAAIAQKVKKAATSKGANTSVGDGNKGKPAPKPGPNGEVSLGEFLKMGIMAKSKLYQAHPEVYNKLVEEAQASKKSLI